MSTETQLNDFVATATEDRSPLPAGGRRIGGRLGAVAIVALALALVTLPLSINDRFWLTILTTAGIFTLGAVSLNLVTGYLGEASLGHAFFMGLGAYGGLWFADHVDAGLLGWAVFVLTVGALAGALTGPLALRMKGGHFLIVTLALVFLGQWIFTNWREGTGGPSGRPVNLPLDVGPVDFASLSLAGTTYSSAQGFAVLVGLMCLVAITIVRNIARSRTGRAMRAIHGNELAASSIGVSLARTKMGAFIVSSAIAALCGALYAQQLRYVEPAVFDLHLSMQFAVVLIIGGAGSTLGPLVGGLFVAAVPQLLQRLEGLPLVLAPVEDGLGMTSSQWSGLVYAVLLVAFLIYEPRGIARMLANFGSRCARVVSGRNRVRNGE